MKHIALMLLVMLVCVAAFAEEKKDDPKPHAEAQAQPQVRVEVQGDAKVQMRAVVVGGAAGGDVQVQVIEMQADADGPKPDVDAKPDAEPEEAKPDFDVPAIEVSILGLSVLKPTPQQAQQRHLRWWGLHNPGTTLVLDARPERGRVVTIRTDKCKLKAFTDDLGNNLLYYRKEQDAGKVNVLNRLRGREDEVQEVSSWIRPWQMHGPGGQFQFLIGGIGTPGEGAMAVMLESDVALLWAGDERKHKVENVSVKPGTKVDVGFTKMEVVDLPEGWGGRENSFGLQFEEKDDVVQERIKQFRFFGADGKELNARHSGSSTRGAEGRRTITRYFNLGEKLEKVTIEVEYYDHTALVTLPLNVTTGVGF
jgi:hypothetical protein